MFSYKSSNKIALKKTRSLAKGLDTPTRFLIFETVAKCGNREPVSANEFGNQ